MTNKPFQVLVWEKYEYKEQLGQPAQELDFDTAKESFSVFDKVDKFLCKMIMKYSGPEPEADGEVIAEEWRPEQ